MTSRGSNKRKQSGFQSSIMQEAEKGFRGYPTATVAYYGPSVELATEAVVSIIPSKGSDPSEVERWHSKGRDIRGDKSANRQIIRFIKRHNVRTVIVPNLIVR